MEMLLNIIIVLIIAQSTVRDMKTGALSNFLNVLMGAPSAILIISFGAVIKTFMIA